MYVNRFVYESKETVSPYLYTSQTTKPTEVIAPINERFVYDYLRTYRPDVLTDKGIMITFEEYKEEMQIYFNRLEQELLEGSKVTLPHFMGIISVQVTVLRRLNYLLKKRVPKKIITLHWEKKYFDKRILNVMKPEWFSVKIKNKNLLRKLYQRIITHGYLYSIIEPNNFSKKLK